MVRAEAAAGSLDLRRAEAINPWFSLPPPKSVSLIRCDTRHRVDLGEELWSGAAFTLKYQLCWARLSKASTAGTETFCQIILAGITQVKENTNVHKCDRCTEKPILSRHFRISFCLESSIFSWDQWAPPRVPQLLLLALEDERCDHTCVERAVPSTRILGDVEHFSGQSSTLRGEDGSKLPANQVYQCGLQFKREDCYKTSHLIITPRL